MIQETVLLLPTFNAKNKWQTIGGFLSDLVQQIMNEFKKLMLNSRQQKCTVYFSVHPQSILSPKIRDSSTTIEEEFLDTATFDLMKEDWWLKRKIIAGQSDTQSTKISLKVRTSGNSTHTVYTEINDEKQIVDKLQSISVTSLNGLCTFAKFSYTRLFEKDFFKMINIQIDECYLPDNITYYVGAINFYVIDGQVDTLLNIVEQFASLNELQEIVQIKYPARSKIIEMMFQNTNLRYYYIHHLELNSYIPRKGYNGYYKTEHGIMEDFISESKHVPLQSVLKSDFESKAIQDFVNEEFESDEEW